MNGSSKVSEEVYNMLREINSLELTIIDSTVSMSLKEMNGYNYQKLKRLYAVLNQLYTTVRRAHYEILYMALNTNMIGIIKILLTLILTYSRPEKIFIHSHLFTTYSRFQSFLIHFFPKISFITMDSSRALLKGHLFLPNSDFITLDISTPKSLPVNKTWNILLISNLYSFKGIFALLEILKQINQKDRLRFRLDLVGDEGDLSFDDIREKCSYLGIKNSVTLLGPVYDRDEKISLLRKADLVVYPSQKDYMPVFLIESLHFGIPIVSSNVGCTDQLVEHGVNGMICNTFKEYITAIEHISSSKSIYESMSRNSLRLYKEMYSQEAIRRVLYDIFLN